MTLPSTANAEHDDSPHLQPVKAAHQACVANLLKGITSSAFADHAPLVHNFP
jgi:hypothetical protein